MYLLNLKGSILGGYDLTAFLAASPSFFFVALEFYCSCIIPPAPLLLGILGISSLEFVFIELPVPNVILDWFLCSSNFT